MTNTSANSLISFHLIIIKILEKCLSRNSFSLSETCNFTKTTSFWRYSGIIPIIQEYLQNIDFPCLLSKFLQQF